MTQSLVEAFALAISAHGLRFCISGFVFEVGGLTISVLKIRVAGLRFRIQSVEDRNFGFRVHGSWFQSSGFRVQGSVDWETALQLVWKSAALLEHGSGFRG